MPFVNRRNHFEWVMVEGASKPFSSASDQVRTLLLLYRRHAWTDTPLYTLHGILMTNLCYLRVTSFILTTSRPTSAIRPWWDFLRESFMDAYHIRAFSSGLPPHALHPARWSTSRLFHVVSLFLLPITGVTRASLIRVLAWYYWYDQKEEDDIFAGHH